MSNKVTIEVFLFSLVEVGSFDQIPSIPEILFSVVFG